MFMLAAVGCTYSDTRVGRAKTITAQQAYAYAYDQAGGDIPVPIEDHAGPGPAVQPDRMITMDIALSDTDNNPISSSRLRFVHSSHDKSLGPWAGYTFGYLPSALLAAMAGMREGGSRKVRITDNSCEDTYPSTYPKILSTFPSQCTALGAMRERPYSTIYGSIHYPRGKPVLMNISIVQVCRPWILREDFPDIMGGGPHVRLIEVWCR
jgi:hypothetical protein